MRAPLSRKPLGNRKPNRHPQALVAQLLITFAVSGACISASRQPVTSSSGERAAAMTSGTTLPPKLIYKVEPFYPEEARQRGVEGFVILEALVTSAGTVESTRILRSLDPLLDAAAANAVKQWKYQPASAAGEPVRCYLTITVTFSRRK
jgi:TonB family protein